MFDISQSCSESYVRSLTMAIIKVNSTRFLARPDGSVCIPYPISSSIVGLEWPLIGFPLTDPSVLNDDLSVGDISHVLPPVPNQEFVRVVSSSSAPFSSPFSSVLFVVRVLIPQRLVQLSGYSAVSWDLVLAVSSNPISE